MTDIRVVVPSDIGSSIQLGVKETNKYDVVFPTPQVEINGDQLTVTIDDKTSSAVTLPAQKEITEFSLQEKTLHIRLGQDAEKTVDLTPMLPAVVAEVFLKQVEKVGNQLQFTVGEKDNDDNNTVLTVDVADLLPVKADDSTIAGDGTEGNKLHVKVSQEQNNAIQVKDDGLFVAPATASIRLLNATGATELGRIFPAESL